MISSGENKLAILYTTVGTYPQAETLAYHALQARMAVCVNISSAGKSFYLEEGRIASAEEYYIIFKTTEACLPGLKDFIVKHHPYETPALLTWMTETSASFSKYALKSLKAM